MPAKWKVYYQSDVFFNRWTYWLPMLVDTTMLTSLTTQINKSWTTWQGSSLMLSCLAQRKDGLCWLLAFGESDHDWQANKTRLLYSTRWLKRLKNDVKRDSKDLILTFIRWTITTLIRPIYGTRFIRKMADRSEKMSRYVLDQVIQTTENIPKNVNTTEILQKQTILFI